MTTLDIAALRSLRRAITVVAAVNLFASGLFVWQSSHARQQNCERVREAFSAYTDALAEVSQADPERVQVFRDAYEPELEACH